MSKIRIFVALLLCTVIFGGVYGFLQFVNMKKMEYFANLPPPIFSVAAQPAQTQEWRDSVQAIGTLRAVRGVEVSASVSGLVEKIGFESGQLVKKGQSLVELDSDIERGNLVSAEADAELARLSARRQRTLIKTSSVSLSALDKSEAELKVREAALVIIHAQIEKKNIIAPFDGVLGVRRVNLGQYVQPGQMIVNLQDLSIMLADFTVSQRYLTLLKTGAKLRITSDSWPGRIFDGSIQAVEPLIDSASGMVRVEGRFPNPEGQLRPGMFVRVEILQEQQQQVVTIPVSAISYNLYGDSVFIAKESPPVVIKKDGKEESKPVKQVDRVFVSLGERREGRVVVLKGVSDGDLVITSGQVKLGTGSKVDILPNDPLNGDNKTVTSDRSGS